MLQPSATSRAIRRRSLRELIDPVGDVVFRQIGKVRTETVGLDRVAADLEVGIVDRPDDVGPRHAQDFVATLEPLEVVEAQVETLQHGAHGAVGNDHPAK